MSAIKFDSIIYCPYFDILWSKFKEFDPNSFSGLNVVSNIRRLAPVGKLNPEDPNEPPPITIPLPKPIIPDNLLSNMQAPMATLTPLGALSFAQIQQHMVPE